MRPILPILPAVASLLVLAGCGRPAAAPAPRSVAVVAAARTDLENAMILQAEFEPYQDIPVHAKVSGYVSQIPVDIGDRVKAGDLIALLEVPELSDQLEGAIAAEKRAAADHAIAHLDFDRLRQVNQAQPNLVAQQEIDDAEAKDAASEAALATAHAEADRYRALWDYTRVTAPFDGVITRRFADLGSLIQAGTSGNSEPIVQLAQDNLLRLRFPVPEAQTPLIRDGEPVAVEVDALHDHFTGKIVRDAWAIDRSTRTLLTEVDVPNPDGRIKAGMYASIRLPLESAPNALAIPLQAVVPGDSPAVYLVQADGTLVERAVRLGMRTANRAEVLSGLTEGDRVVVGDTGELHAGDRVTPRLLDVSPAD